MNPAIPLALYAWVPLVAILFLTLRPSTAVLVAYFAGWMFLPVPGIEVGGLDWNKTTAVPLVVFLAVACFDTTRLLRFQPRLADLPIAVFCVVPLLTSLANGLGWYDGISSAMYQTVVWGLPWLTGRVYFSHAEGLRRLALALFVSGLVYAPLCLWEIRMSPQLHAWVYGEHQHVWVQTLRSHGYRPMVFMHHGLMVGLWMSLAALAGYALWRGGSLRRIAGMPAGPLVAALFVVAFLCQSFGASALLLGGATLLGVTRRTRATLPMAVLLVLPMLYVGARATGTWSGRALADAVSQLDPQRGNSLAVRIESEEKLRVRAAEKPLLGWGGWGRSLVRAHDDDPSRTETVTIDSLWIIVYGKYGIVGLASLLLAFLAPPLVLWRRCPPSSWDRPGVAGAWVLALALTLYAIDNVVNAMVNPIYLLGAGALAGLAPLRARAPAPAVAARAVGRAPRIPSRLAGVAAP
jgi:hypothetical protein